MSNTIVPSVVPDDPLDLQRPSLWWFFRVTLARDHPLPNTFLQATIIEFDYHN